VLAVRRPALNGVRAWVPRQSLRLAAFRRNHVHVRVAGVLSSECDPLAVWREVRVCRLALETRDTPRGASTALDDPDVVRVCKGNLRCADGWRSQQARLAAVRGRRERGCEKRKEQPGKAVSHCVLSILPPEGGSHRLRKRPSA